MSRFVDSGALGSSLPERAEELGIRDPLLSACGVAHAFGTRSSAAPADTLRPQQVHGVEVARISSEGGLEPRDADAVVSRAPGRPVAVVTADCVPLLATNSAGDAVVAIHAGWRGLAAGIVVEGIEALRDECREQHELRVAIGPHIGACCYEVDEPVLAAMRTRFATHLEAASTPTRSGRVLLDMSALVRIELARLGVGEMAQSVIAAACTRCHPARFHSYRRDGPRAGRLIHYIAAASRGPHQG